MPATYTYKRRIGAVLTDGSNVLKPFSQNGDQFLWKTVEVHSRVNNPGTSAVLRTISTPLGIKIDALMNVAVYGTSATNVSAYFSSPDVNDESLVAGRAQLSYSAAFGAVRYFAGLNFVRTNTSSQIRTRVSASDANVDLDYATAGWIDPRGRNA
jgi:hypothetical protein